ncbi:MAG: T9SS type A sorting domain-containing protein, partial [Bacteroidales bacterium]|nr:T9SS type A sorting domain-containing protein [Bacteroidales bacterium]
YENDKGCASADTLHLTVNYGTHNVLDTTVCESFVWNNRTYTESGTYAYDYENDKGCASADTLHLTVNHGTHNVLDTTVCESFVWNNQTYTESGTYAYDYENDKGCASADTLHLTVNHGTHNVLDTTVCNSYEWNGESYTVSGTYTYDYDNETGCVSTDTLHLTISESVTIEAYLTIHDSDLPYTIGDTTFRPGEVQSGDYTIFLPNEDGCDTILTLHLTVLETGVNDHVMNASMNVYPNPTQDKVNVQLKMNNERFSGVEIQLYDMYGKWLNTWKVSGEITEIDLSPYAASVYFIKAVDGQHLLGVRKIVRQ